MNELEQIGPPPPPPTPSKPPRFTDSADGRAGMYVTACAAAVGAAVTAFLAHDWGMGASELCFAAFTFWRYWDTKQGAK
jgi:hypothetical protein